MKNVFLAVLACAACGSAVAREVRLPTKRGMGRLMQDATSRPVRPGNRARGVPFWNEYSRFFEYAPAFDFKPVKGAARYRFTVIGDSHEFLHFEADTPDAPLSPVWGRLPVGQTTVICRAVDESGRELGDAGRRTFWKAAAFGGYYPAGKRPYGEAARMILDYLASNPAISHLAEHGKVDFTYKLNCYPSKMHASNIRVMLGHAELRPERKAEAYRIARAEADYLISLMQPADVPLAFFTPTYATDPELRENETAGFQQGQTMNIYPADVATAFVRLGKATGERKYIEAAERIASTFMRTQLECGTWYIKQYFKDAKPVVPNLMIPTSVIEMLEALFEVTGDARYRSSADRAFAWIMENPVRTWNWEGHFEDTPPAMPYFALTKHTACDALLEILKRYPGDKGKLALCREIMNFCEDQFAVWEVPFRPGMEGYGHCTVWLWNPEWLPAGLEQYPCYKPIDASSIKLVRAYLALYRAGGELSDLMKAKALADAMTRAQEDDGRLRTFFYTKFSRGGDWVNCMGASALGLMEMAHYQAICDALAQGAGDCPALVPSEIVATVEGRKIDPPCEDGKFMFSKAIPIGEEYVAEGEIAYDIPADGEYWVEMNADWRLWVTFEGKEIFAMPDGFMTKDCVRERYMTLKKGRNVFKYRYGAGTRGAWMVLRIEPLSRTVNLPD